MDSVFHSPEEYELFLYTIRDHFPIVQHSTITFVRLGATLVRVAGELSLEGGIRLVVRERLLSERDCLLMDSYGYEVWRGKEKLYWYDSQPHPNDPCLQSSHPHHKHLPPDIKHNRIPAPEMRFDGPNLPFLLREAEKLLR